MDPKKELLEAIAALKVLALVGKGILKDGKVSIADLPVLMSLLTNQQVLVDGVAGLKELDIKALDLEGGIEIARALAEAVKAVRAA